MTQNLKPVSAAAYKKTVATIRKGISMEFPSGSVFKVNADFDLKDRVRNGNVPPDIKELFARINDSEAVAHMTQEEMEEIDERLLDFYCEAMLIEPKVVSRDTDPVPDDAITPDLLLRVDRAHVLELAQGNVDVAFFKAAQKR